MWFELLAFEFECIRNQASLWGPGLCTKTDLLRDLKALKFGCGKQHCTLETSWPLRWVRVRRRNNTLDTTRNSFPPSISLPFLHFLFPPQSSLTNAYFPPSIPSHPTILPDRAASVMMRRTSLSMSGLLQISSQLPRNPLCSASAINCFWLGTTKPITYDWSLGRRELRKWRDKIVLLICIIPLLYYYHHSSYCYNERQRWREKDVPE